MPSRFKVVITDYDYGDVDIERAILAEIGAEVVALQAKSEPDLFAAVAHADAVMNQYARVGAATIARMQQCKVIARYGVGVDIVDVDAATARNIAVTNVRDYCTEEVADHAVALWLSLVRNLDLYNRATHRGEWRWQSGRPVHRTRGRTMGIVSFGKIGRAIASRVAAFGVEIAVFDPYLDAAAVAATGARKVDKDTLLRESDYICMQAPMTPETRHFLSDREFRLMKRGAIVVNTGRGPTIDNRALYDAIQAGIVAGAGLDDPEEEPAKRASWNPADNLLFTLPNVMATPHSAYYSEESIRAAREIAASEVARVLSGRPPLNPVNPPAQALLKA